MSELAENSSNMSNNGLSLNKHFKENEKFA